MTSRLALLLALIAAPLGAAPTPPRTPDEELATFRLADSRWQIECVAAEPEVSSPVALAWDELGRLWVAEMRDYPNATFGGAIRRLEDTNGDGRADTSVVFAEALPFPNSILPWRGGVLVTAAPDLWFLRDIDGDGRADERQVLFTGFGTGNQQLRANGLFWGLDGWVYGANGRSDGEIRRQYQPRWTNGILTVEEAPSAGSPVSLRGRDFRFRPDTGEFETLAGRSQFGHARDDWGNRFLSWNTIPLRHEVLPDRFLADRPALASLEILQDCLPPGDVGEVFPLTPPPLVFNNESGSHFNALSGLHVYRGDALGADTTGQAFVGESLRNLVHRRRLVPEGPTFRAERTDAGIEVLVSSDPWFHPVNFGTGPDGALYVADFYRQFVEHPDWVAREMRTQVKWDQGRDRGRIWRVRRRSSAPVPMTTKPLLATLTSDQLVRELDHPNGWRRDTAQRLLWERSAPESVSRVEAFLTTAQTPAGRVAALHTWSRLGGTNAAIVTNALQDANPRVRAAAARLAGRLELAPASEALRLALQDPDPFVQLEAALSLRRFAAYPDTAAALQRLGETTTNRWIALAAAAGSTEDAVPWMSKIQPPTPLARPLPQPRDPDPDRERVVNSLRAAATLTGDPKRGAVTCARLCLACHYLQGQGQRVGPDLGGLSSRPTDTLLRDILDPSRQVAPDYQGYELILADGQRLTGLIASESETRLTLRQPGTPDVSVARSQLKEIRATGRSLMPEGLEAGLGTQDLADLLAFLRSPQADWLPTR